MSNVQIETAESFARGLAAQGYSVERLNLQNMRPVSGMHQNALLQRYEWEEIDAAVVDVARNNLNGISDLLDRGLVQSLGGLGTLTTTYEQLGDMTAANISMDGETAGEEDSTPYTPISLPVPIIHKDFRINIRTLEASRRLGDALDTSGVETATRQVLEAAEAMLFNGTGAPQVGANVAQGYTNKTQRLSDTASNFGGGDFGTEGNGYSTIAGMINQLKGDGFMGPFVAYVARTQYGQLTARHTDGSGMSELRAIVENIPDLDAVKASDDLTAGSVVVVTMSRNVVDVAIAADLQVVQWQSKGGMVDHFKVMWAGTPRVKHDARSSGNCGIAHATAA